MIQVHTEDGESPILGKFIDRGISKECNTYNLLSTPLRMRSLYVIYQLGEGVTEDLDTIVELAQSAEEFSGSEAEYAEFYLTLKNEFLPVLEHKGHVEYDSETERVTPTITNRNLISQLNRAGRKYEWN